LAQRTSCGLTYDVEIIDNNDDVDDNTARFTVRYGYAAAPAAGLSTNTPDRRAIPLGRSEAPPSLARLVCRWRTGRPANGLVNGPK
jgi:hypothetical protein